MVLALGSRCCGQACAGPHPAGRRWMSSTASDVLSSLRSIRILPAGEADRSQADPASQRLKFLQDRWNLRLTALLAKYNTSISTLLFEDELRHLLCAACRRPSAHCARSQVSPSNRPIAVRPIAHRPFFPDRREHRLRHRAPDSRQRRSYRVFCVESERR